MRCYYEELGLARDSNEGDIKTAYRKLALRWHPDKNPDCLAEAKERFQLIQQAYEVLSDAQERAWYDNHREQILRGKNSEYSENCLDVFQYFTGSCYKGYGNDAQGFYGVYRDVFNNIASEDLEFMDSDDEMGPPQFGNADSSYEDVVAPFYAYWLSYSTKKTYEWLCPYDVREIKERFILRKVEKQMKKIVQNARKDRNEEVRNLVSFVRKRDRRVQAYRLVLEERAEANRLKQEEKRKEQLRQRQEQLAAVRANKVDNDGYEEQLRQLEQEYGSESDDYTDEEAEEDELDSDAAVESDNDVSEQEVEYVDDLYCVACNKSFKNTRARSNHEESKKHRENVERLCQQMADEEQEYNEHSEDLNAAEDGVEQLKISGAQKTDQSSDQAELSSDEEVQQTQSKRNKKGKKSKKPAPKAIVESDEDDEADAAAAAAPDQAVDLSAPVSNSDDADDDDWSRSKKSAKKSKSKKSTSSKQKAETEKEKLTTESKPKSKPTAAPPRSNETAPLADVQHTCVTCKLVFDSKNKLFAHLKKTNHGVYLPKAKPEVEGKPPGKAKGKRK
ncbi:dnaJ homolog subfamily C member 21 [Drosophila grimshawi]|uniref:DnaJ homolog subfamily C member 21 n=1 Tax=Drosophila grimshawi TaxID=7222 RepID=B4J9M5_DROGR|nr:dnaJ homolog subfamily C member 21 [Drosophila grimshawi]EDW02532.1 GH22046 [Drosophila grimshawi]